MRQPSSVNASRTGCRSASLLMRPIGKPVPPGLRHVDVHRDLPQPAFDHQPLQKLRVLDQRLAVRHQHRHEPDRVGVADDLDQFVLPPGAPICIGDIAAGDLQTAAGTLRAAVRVDLLLHVARATASALRSRFSAGSSACSGTSKSSRRA